MLGSGDLSNDRGHEADNRIRTGLDREYPEWKNPTKTYVVPPSFPRKHCGNNGVKAEEAVYNLLQQLGEQNDEPMFVVHSVDFSEHIPGSGRKRSWVMGETDFVIIHRKHGPIMIQVKATEDGKAYKEAEEQLRKDKLVLQKYYEKLVKGKISGKKTTELFKNFPAFVAMPNCKRGAGSVCIKDNALYQEDCSSLEAFADWWQKRIASAEHPVVSQTVFEHLVMSYVGLVHCIPCPLADSVDRSHKVLCWRTNEQLKVMLSTAPEQWITGPAGSGKTWILIEKVKSLAARLLLHGSKEKILAVCFNLPLSKMLRKAFEDHQANLLRGNDLSSVVEVKTFSKLLYEMTGKFSESDQEKQRNIASAVELLEKGVPQHLQQYDHIFVDECQDLVGDRWPMLFKKLLKDDDDDDDPKHMWFFYDTNQYLGLSEQQYELNKKSLKKSSKLTQVLRNTGNIFDQSKKYFKSQVPAGDSVSLGHNEYGLPIRWDVSLPENIGVKSVVSHVKELRSSKFQDKDICVLVENVEIQKRLSSELKMHDVDNQNAEECFEISQNKVVVESVRRFKGLEAKVIILYNPRFFVDNEWDVKKVKAMLYTAVSRCCCYLVVITTARGYEALKSDDGVQEGILKGSQQQRPTPMRNSQNLASEKRLQVQALFKDQFGRRSMETKYESGPPEFSSKRSHEEEDERNDETEPAMVQVSAMEEMQYKRHYEKCLRMGQSEKLRPMRVNGSNLLEPGDQTRFQDKIRNRVFNLLCETVGQNLTYLPSSSAMDPSTLNVRNMVAQIEYSVYCERRNDRDTNVYTTVLRNLKKEITKSNEEKQCHEAVIKALRSLDISSTATVSME